MSYKERLKLYEQISDIRKRPLIVYVTSCRKHAEGMMGSDVLSQFAKVLSKVPTDGSAIDVLIVSNGGDPIVPWRLISMLRERYKKIGALLPWAAYSAATLLALGADEIVMHPFSNLGPVDPQLQTQRKIPGQPPGQDKQTIAFGAEDIRYFLEFVKNDIGISDQAQLQQSFELICKEVGSIPIGTAKRSTQLSVSMSEKLLNLHLKDTSKAKAIAESFSGSFYHHGYAVGLGEARKLGLPVIAAPENLAPLLWEAWLDIEQEMECETPFNPIKIIMDDEKICPLLQNVLQVNMPANMPTQLVQQAYNQVLSQISVVQVPEIKYNLFRATLECRWCKSEFRTRGSINAVRKPDMELVVKLLPTSSEWEFEEN